jgi:DMSO/TMAO reductase YedYZ molybdopterin-dependent catalytic subunit
MVYPAVSPVRMEGEMWFLGATDVELWSTSWLPRSRQQPLHVTGPLVLSPWAVYPAWPCYVLRTQVPRYLGTQPLTVQVGPRPEKQLVSTYLADIFTYLFYSEK